MGWGAFNLVEGVIDHHILAIHHVNEKAPREQWLWWDLAFFAGGAIMLLGGWALARTGEVEQEAAAAGRDTPRPLGRSPD